MYRKPHSLEWHSSTITKNFHSTPRNTLVVVTKHNATTPNICWESRYRFNSHSFSIENILNWAMYWSMIAHLWRVTALNAEKAVNSCLECLYVVLDCGHLCRSMRLKRSRSLQRGSLPPPLPLTMDDAQWTMNHCCCPSQWMMNH